MLFFWKYSSGQHQARTSVDSGELYVSASSILKSEFYVCFAWEWINPNANPKQVTAIFL